MEISDGLLELPMAAEVEFDPIGEETTRTEQALLVDKHRSLRIKPISTLKEQSDRDREEDDDYDYITQSLRGLGSGETSVVDGLALLKDRILTASTTFNDQSAFFWNLATSISKAAQMTDHSNQQPLVDILAGVRKDSILCNVRLHAWNTEVPLSPLPLFGPYLREEMDCIATHSACYVNFHAFCARLTANGINDCTLFGLWSLREALEEEKEERLERVYAAVVSAACMYLIYAPIVMYTCCKEETEMSQRCGTVVSAMDKQQQSTLPGSNMQRWQIWKTRLSRIRELNPNSDAVPFINEAMRKMEGVESDTII